MNAQALLFRFRFWIFALLYLAGFLAPWERLVRSAPAGTLWLAAATLLARTHWVSLERSTVLVTAAALGACIAGAALRVWGTAWLGAAAVQTPVIEAAHGPGGPLVAAGPYRYLRHPLYAGSFLFALGVSILMPPGGALFFLVALALFELALISGEERFLAGALGDEYRQYRQSVPPLLPGAGSRPNASARQPRWLEALLAEIYPVGYTLCFAVLAWRYNAFLLIKCLIICFGAAIVVRALLAPSRPKAPADPN